MRALNLAQVLERTSMGRTYIYAAIQDGTFPRPAKIGRRSLWNEDAIDAWLAATFASNVPEPANTKKNRKG
jgi:prophage regulatory protein